ncbi:MAG: tRNA (N(6)-L-threonylcarbamoyladenosine(37)-C(2))-methylthiotransferase MtaB [Desulfobacteraceae bacterium]
MKHFYITTLGCKVNHYESDAISSQLCKNGFKKTNDLSKADYAIVNSCAVTARAAMQSRQAARKIIKASPNARVVFTGCHAQTEPEQVKSIDHLYCIAGHRDKFRLAQAISASENNNDSQGLESIALPAAYCRENTFISFEPAVTGDKTRAYLKIQDGCNAFCTYCIIPHARGRSRSMPENEVMRHLRELNRLGYQEAIITGIHAGEYGHDFKEKSSLSHLFQTIASKKLIHRVRLSSIEPKELTDEIIDIAARGDILCDHFHISLQSGDDRILKSMHRPYDADFFRQLIWKIHEKMPFAAIGADLLMGFPGETKPAFENTLSLITSLPLAYLHVFPFSPRKGTPAYHFPDKVDPRIIKARCAVMRQISREKTKLFKQKNTGRLLDAVIQGKRDLKTGLLTAVTSNYLTLLVKGDDLFLNKALKVKLRELRENNILYGTIESQ